MIRKFLLGVRRGESPGYRALKKLARAILSFNLPLPRFALILYRGLYGAFQLARVSGRWVLCMFVRVPVFRSLCVQAGKRLFVSRVPFIVGHPRIYLGDDVNFFGTVDIMSGASYDEPKLTIKDRVDVGHRVIFVVNKEILIEEDVRIATGAQFRDSDAHPRDAARRIAGMRPDLDEIRPIRVCRYAWIGSDAMIMKGVTVGEGAIVGAQSVVVTDVPPYTVVMGNPARLVVKGLTPVGEAPAGTAPQDSPPQKKPRVDSGSGSLPSE
jgi:acetyltransferase-like isoleucine patch superfamily enzyme